MTAVTTDSWSAVSGVSEALGKVRSRNTGRAYPVLRWAGALVFVAVLVGVVVTIVSQSSQAFAHSGIGFLWSGTWDPANNRFAAGTLIVATLITTFVAMIIVVPVGLGFATFLSEMAPPWIANPLATAVDLLAATPSIVIGLWALIVLSPVFLRDVEPWLRGLPLLGHLFSGEAYGPSVLLAAVVLAVMALPSVVTLSRTALRGVPVADREAALALGATRWQVIRQSVIPSARSGIAAALTLAVGRALGESIAVALVIGNRPTIPHSLIAPTATLGSAIVNQFAEADPGLGKSSVIALGAVLILLTLLVNLGGHALLRRGSKEVNPAILPAGPAATRTTEDDLDLRTVDDRWESRRAEIRTRAAAGLSRRRISSRLMGGLCAVAVAVGVAPLVALVILTVAKGAGAISWSFLAHAPTPEGIPGGGIGPAITGSARMAGLGLLIALPIGLATALFLYERKGRLAGTIRFAAAVMTGLPSIIVGIFAYGLLVRPMHRYSDLAAGVALAILMLPIMIRANEEALRTVPVDLWEAGVALGAPRSRVASRVVVRNALPGIISGNLLALARAVGETAPLIFTVAAPTLAVTYFVFVQGNQADASLQQQAWGAALVLLAVVLILSFATKALSWALERNTR